jgi:hypothetical protein
MWPRAQGGATPVPRVIVQRTSCDNPACEFKNHNLRANEA